MKPETERLEKLMKLMGWKQTKTAKALGVSQPTIQRLLKESVPMHGSMKVLIEKLIEEACAAKEEIMSCWSKEQLDNMMEDVINALDLSHEMIEKHGPLGTPPSELVRMVLDQKDQQIRMLKAGFTPIAA